MGYKEIIKRVVWIAILMIALVVICAITEILPLGFLGFSKQQIEIEQTSLVQIEVDNNGFITRGNDPQIILNISPTKIRTISFIMDGDNDKSFEGNIYYDKGAGMSQDDSQMIILKNGVNTIDLNTNAKIYNIRIDPTNQSNEVFNISSISVNTGTFNFKKIVIVTLFVCIQFLVSINMKNYILFQLLCSPIWYMCFSFYYNYSRFELSNLVYQIPVMCFCIATIFLIKIGFKKVVEETNCNLY